MENTLAGRGGRKIDVDNFRPIRHAFSRISVERFAVWWLVVVVVVVDGVRSVRSSRLCQRLAGLEGTRTYGLRLVYLRTKCFLFGPRATCASHGGFVAARTREGETANKSKAAPRVRGETRLFPSALFLPFPPLSRSFTFLNLSFLPLSLSLSVLRVTFACVHA